ncbi:MAG: ABC transporter permease [Synergistaceae bacterium]|jgi:simple sugar transport system permease protein|nr:ABC transporter permease [Synergistaceae bacterium]
MKLRAEKRIDSPAWMTVVVTLASVCLAFVAGGVFLYLQGVSPLTAYRMILRSAFGSVYDLSETAVRALPLATVSLAVMLCFTMLIWNIGAEGQAFIGALTAAAVVRYFPMEDRLAMLSLMALAAAVAGGFWAGVAGVLKAKWNVSEIISTLMLNYIAIRLLEHFVYGPWRDPSSLGFPMTRPFIPQARLPQLWGTRIHMGLYGLLILSAFMWLALKKTRWGYEIRIMGSNARAAHYAGMNYARSVVLVMFLSGAIAGIAGMCEVSGLQGRLQAGFSAQYGYTAIIVAWLSHLNPPLSLLVAFLIGALLVGGEALQIGMGLPLASVQILQGLILFFVLGGEFFYNYRVRLDFGRPGFGGER